MDFYMQICHRSKQNLHQMMALIIATLCCEHISQKECGITWSQCTAEKGQPVHLIQAVACSCLISWLGYPGYGWTHVREINKKMDLLHWFVWYRLPSMNYFFLSEPLFPIFQNIILLILILTTTFVQHMLAMWNNLVCQNCYYKWFPWWSD